MMDTALGAATRQGLRIWRVVEILGTIVAMTFSVLVASGWRIQKPGDVDIANEGAITALEKRTTVLESNYAGFRDEMKGVVRMQCLLISRHDANLAGTCTGLPTRDESPRAGR